MDVVFILVEPAVAENIGAAARAIKTMGFDKLYLVNPCNHLSGPARWLAHASNDILENAKVFSSLPEASQEIDYIIATSAKPRHVKADFFPIDDLFEIIMKKGSSINTVAIVFGREESGLTNDEIGLCDLLSFVPMKNLYPSLNLAQSVMLYAYMFSGLNHSSKTMKNEPSQGYPIIKSKAEKALEQMDFVQNSNIYNRILERLAFLSEDDLHLVHSICNKIIK